MTTTLTRFWSTDADDGNSPFDWRGRLGWFVSDVAEVLQHASHRITHGETPTLETTSVDDLHRISVWSGIPASALAGGHEAPPATRRIAARVYTELVSSPVTSDRLEAVADALGVDVLALVQKGDAQ